MAILDDLDGVPLYLGGNEAEHSAENLRLQTYQIFRGQQGFLTATAGKVRALDIPGSGVLVAPGPWTAVSNFPGGDQQSYASRILREHQVDTEPNATNNVRYDLVWLNVEDPYPSGGTIWPFPGAPGSEERRRGPYWRVRIIKDVPSNTICIDDLPINRVERTWTGLACALITRPANTGTVLPAHIRPLNIVCNPLVGVGVPDSLYDDIGTIAGVLGGVLSGKIAIPGRFTQRKGCTEGSNVLRATDTNFKRFPKEATFSVLVPPWATHADVFCMTSGVWQGATSANERANVYGTARIAISDTSVIGDNNAIDQDELNDNDNRPPPPNDSTQYDFGTKQYRPGNRLHVVASANLVIPSDVRNKRQNFEVQARMYPDRNTKGKLVADTGTAIWFDIVFREKA